MGSFSLVHLELDDTTGWAVRRGDTLSMLPLGLDSLLGMPLADARAVVETATGPGPTGTPRHLPAVDRQEVWAAGVTYLRSRDGRMEESVDGSPYDRVYTAERPELFFKSLPHRVVGDGEAVGIRADSAWNVPEAELGLVVNSAGEIFGYLVGNDMSSRSIEGENLLYLPQAKVYDRACALGSSIVPIWEAPDAPWGISLAIRRDGVEVFSGTTSTSSIVREFADLASWLVLAMDFPEGAVLLTGTGIVPEADFTLKAGDVIRIVIDGIGELSNPVVTVGRPTIRSEERA
jgi:2-dehydro-3-deoxy-D-arabinonate dehydratase